MHLDSAMRQVSMSANAQLGSIERELLNLENIFDQARVEHRPESGSCRLQPGADLVAKPAELLCGNLRVTRNGVQLREVLFDRTRMVVDKARKVDSTPESRGVASRIVVTVVYPSLIVARRAHQ